MNLVETGTDDGTIMDVAMRLSESIDWWEIGANPSRVLLVAAKK